jgi:hypothetical protein
MLTGLYLIIVFTLQAVLCADDASAAPQDVGVDYDIVYVRYPLGDQSDPANPTFITVPQGEHAYRVVAGADLMLLHPDGSEEVLVDCTTCSVMDPTVSFNGRR